LKVVNSSFNDQFLARSNTLTTQDAFAKIPFNEWIDFLYGGHLGDPLEFNQSDAHIRGKLAQLTAVALVTHQAGIRMTGNQQLNYVFTMLYDSRGMGIDNHSWCYRGNTRCH
jgi:hypothetical protein